MGVLLNGFFLFDFIMVYLLERWKRNNQQDILDWIELCGWTDAMISLAGFAWNHPGFHMPEILEQSDKLKATGLGHPLIPHKKRINNDMEISKDKVVIRVTGSDTMVNLAQAWAENYSKKRPDVSIQVAGGGSGVGIAGLINGIVDIANCSRKFKEKEIARAKAKHGREPTQIVVGYDALAVYVHKDNPLDAISIEELSKIYGDGGEIVKWSQLGIKHDGCGRDEIVRVSRQNNSGTYHYFRERVVGKGRDFKQGSVDQSGSKDVVALVSKTPCAIGYSGMAYATPEVKTLKIAAKKGGEAFPPTKENATQGKYEIARPLFLYTNGKPAGPAKDYIDWILSPEGQKIVDEIGYVPVKPAGG
jgi:phosphate transport system substrate-binding protein